MKFFLIIALASKDEKDGYGGGKIVSSYVYRHGTYANEKEALGDCVLMGNEHLPYAEGWSNHKHMVKEVITGRYGNSFVSINVGEL